MIGATGGSGTRIVARIVREAGLFIGTDRNDYEDALPLGAYSDRWINEYVASSAQGGLPDELRRQMAGELERVLAGHRSDQPPDARAWGWKEPRSIYYLPFLHGEMPRLRFLHFIRDGRDMAFSENQQQLSKHGEAALSAVEARRRRPVRSIALWTRVNEQAADYGESRMGDRYLCVRFEDLCRDSVATLGRIFGFFGIEGDAERAAAAVRDPGSIGRWQKGHRKKTIEELHEVAEPALARFGYL